MGEISLSRRRHRPALCGTLLLSMKRILTALVLIPLVLVAVFLAADWLLFALIGAVAILALSEYLHIIPAYQAANFRMPTVLITAAYFAMMAAALFVRSTNALEIVLLATAAVFFFAPFVYLAAALAYVPAKPTSDDPAQKDSDMRPLLPGAAMAFFGIPYIGASLACLGVIRSTPAGWFLVVFTCLAVWVGDSAAMYVGKAFGRHKFSPRVSPNKTWEGAIASVAGAVIVCALYGHFAPQIEHGLASIHQLPEPGTTAPPLPATRVWASALFAAIINIAAQLGDLFESLIKRGAGVKDSGTLLPGHGGMLDRIDALLFAAPVALVMFTLLGSALFQ